MQTPKEFVEAVSAAHAAIEGVPQVTVLAELEHAARPPAKIVLLFKDFLPQIIALTFIAFVLGSSLGVAIGRHVHR